MTGVDDVYRLRFVLTRDQLLTANDRPPHWSVRHKRTRYLRGLAADVARLRRVPPMRRARIVAWVSWPDRRRRDRLNLAPTVKALVDGVVDAGVLPDDSDRYLDGPDTRTTDRLSTPTSSLLVPVIHVFEIELEIREEVTPDA